MQQITVKQQIDRKLEVLPVDVQRKVLFYIDHLTESSIQRGISGKKLAHFAGILSEEDAKELSHIIEEGCEKIDGNEW